VSSVLASVAVYSAVMAAYLATRGVPARRIGTIFAWGAKGGVVLSVGLGILYYAIDGLRPVETLAFAFMVAVAFAAAVVAREQILGSISALGIIFLNIAVNFAPEGPLPLRLSWLEMFYWELSGHRRAVLDAAVLHLPALLALLLLLARGSSVLGFLLGLWASWIGIATLAGPAWQAFTQFRPSEPLQWLWLLAAAYAAVHVGLLALNFVFAATDRHTARSMARSVITGQRSALAALLWGFGFWVVMYLLQRLPLPAPERTALAIALALALDRLLTAEQAVAPGDNAAAEEDETPPFFSGAGFQGIVVFIVWTLLMLVFAQASWKDQLQPGDKAFNVSAEIVLLVSTSYFIVLAGMLVRASLRESGRSTSLPIVPGAVLIFVVCRLSMTPLWPGWDRDVAWQSPGLHRLVAEEAPCRLAPEGGGTVRCATDAAPLNEVRPSRGPTLGWVENPQRFYRVEYADVLRPQAPPTRRSILCIETQLQAGSEALPGLVLVPLAFESASGGWTKSAGTRVLYDDRIRCGDLMQAARSRKFIYRFRNLRSEFERPLPSGEPRENAGLALI
jgi:NADH:ubiquinone oxidoreductase subunit 6 (subunit J)